MITRQQLYGGEATELLRVITMYKSLQKEQLYRLFPGKEEKIKQLLAHLVKQGRIVYSPQSKRFSASLECENKADSGMIAAFWVALDFIDRIEYHTASEYPVCIMFFADGEAYEIVYVPFDKEALVSHALSSKDEDAPRRIILVDNPDQIPQISIPNINGFCTVDINGDVRYYKLSQE